MEACIDGAPPVSPGEASLAKFDEENSSIERQHQLNGQEEQQVVDAICKRTRAQYSLADMSLDELETFLQESDEEDYFQNVDDEEEYRKFIAAVQGKWDDGTQTKEHDAGKEGEEDEDEDEEDDYDFEIEIEEALESDYEETSKGEAQKRKRRAIGRRSETREKRRHRARPKIKERLLGLAKTPLRPLLPSLGGKDFATDASKTLEERLFTGKPDANGFTAHQIGQLHRLIHEHVQLLVQVFSLCILEPSRQQIAIETHRLLMQLVEKRDQVLSWKKTAFPDVCFNYPHFYTSASLGKSHNYFQPVLSKFQDNSFIGANVDVSKTPVNSDHLTFKGSALVFSDSVYANAHDDGSPVVSLNGSINDNNTHVSPKDASTQGGDIASSSGLCSPKAMANMSVYPETPPTAVGGVGREATRACCSSVHLQPNVAGSVVNPKNGAPLLSEQVIHNGSGWAPVVSEPVFSLLDVAALALVKDFLSDVAQAVEAYRQRHVETGAYHSQCGREPLFPSHIVTDYQVGHADAYKSKKTTPTALVESTKNENIALVPKEISAIIGRFAPLFNPGLFPHIPPAATANRLLFTEAEDELLAMGLMTYNTNWDAIQKYFLPPKTTHQIFVRQKNQSSARAPENTIKAVRRLKGSPLTKEEKSCIQEGLKYFKNDWTKVWQHCVPYRDPAALPRQWRVAVGTQKLYKSNEEAREKHRISEARRRREKDASKSTVCDDDDGEDASRAMVHDDDDGKVKGGDDVYLHEAFLTDWRPSSGNSTSAMVSVAAHPESAATLHCSASEGNLLKRPCQKSPGSQKNVGKRHMVNPSISGGQSQQMLSCTFSDCPTSSRLLMAHQQVQTYRSCRKAMQTIKLAPGLPSLNLPPSVRVISQSKWNPAFPNNVTHVFSQQKCMPSFQNRKGNLATLSSHPPVPFICPKPDLTLPETDNRKPKPATELHVENHQSAPVCQSEIGRNYFRVASGQSGLKNKKASRFINSVVSSQMLDSLDLSIPSAKQTGSVKESPWSQMHPLLMQGTFESLSVSKTCSLQKPKRNASSGTSQCKAVTGQLQQQVPQFHPFFGAPLDKGIVTKAQALCSIASSSNQSSAGPGELHPFLQREDEHQTGLLNQVRGAVGPQFPAQMYPHTLATSGCILDASNIQRPCAPSDAVIRPEPVRAVQEQQKRQRQEDIFKRGRGSRERNTSMLTVHKTRGSKAACREKIFHHDLVTCKKKGKGNVSMLEFGGGGINTSIVMEEEELSDSDEEVEEEVQFEYEEIGDSEREESDHKEHVSEVGTDMALQYQEDGDIEFEEEEIGSDDSDDEGAQTVRGVSGVQLVQGSVVPGNDPKDSTVPGVDGKTSLKQAGIFTPCGQEMDSESKETLEKANYKERDVISGTQYES